ncbi:MAG: hypothetical protein LBN93_11385 [Candidatus Symbiothrix sp.]|jgi:large-conductance mechanosensitive channel|nr:hypothetical protein [Candidatus Symbiothrix sp.]
MKQKRIIRFDPLSIWFVFIFIYFCVALILAIQNIINYLSVIAAVFFLISACMSLRYQRKRQEEEKEKLKKSNHEKTI